MCTSTVLRTSELEGYGTFGMLLGTRFDKPSALYRRMLGHVSHLQRVGIMNKLSSGMRILEVKPISFTFFRQNYDSIQVHGPVKEFTLCVRQIKCIQR